MLNIKCETSAFFKSGFTRGEVVIVAGILLFLSLLGNYHFNLAKAKARDFERKEQLKRVDEALGFYLVDHGVYPPHASEWRLTGCGDIYCPVDDGKGIPCNWEESELENNLSCGEGIYLQPIPRSPVNPKLDGKNTHRYRRLEGQRMVLETCLELSFDIEAIDVSNSQTELTKDICGSGAIFQIAR